MLLPIKPDTSHSAIFTALNSELGAFLQNCITENSFRSRLFTGVLKSAIWSNAPTKKKFIKLRGGEKEADRVKVKREIVFYIPPSADKDGLQRIVGMENVPANAKLATTKPELH